MSFYVVESEAYQAWKILNNKTRSHSHFWRESELVSLARTELEPPFNELKFDKAMWNVDECGAWGSLKFTNRTQVIN